MFLHALRATSSILPSLRDGTLLGESFTAGTIASLITGTISWYLGILCFRRNAVRIKFSPLSPDHWWWFHLLLPPVLYTMPKVENYWLAPEADGN